MSEFHGYFMVRVSPSLTGAQLLKVRDAIKGMGRQSDNQPARITHLRPSLDNRAVIGEIVLPDTITKAQAVTALANALGVSEATVTSNIADWQVFAGSSWEERRQACVAWLAANSADWEGGS